MQDLESIRNRIIDMVMQIKDKEHLLAIDSLLQSKSSVDMPIDDDLAALISMGLEDVKEGRTITQEELREEMKTWKSKRPT